MTVVQTCALPISIGHLKQADEVSGGITDLVVGMRFPSSFTKREIDESMGVVEKILLDKQDEWRFRAVRARRSCGVGGAYGDAMIFPASSAPAPRAHCGMVAAGRRGGSCPCPTIGSPAVTA